MSDDVYPLSLVVRKDVSPHTKMEPNFEPRTRFKAMTERVNLEGRAEEILVEIEPNLQDDEDISIGDEQQKPDQVNIEEDDSCNDSSNDDVDSSPIRDIFDADELSFSICRKTPGDVLLSCPFCSDEMSIVDSGRHFLSVHRLSKLTCPGRNCPKKIQNVALFPEHVHRHHFDLECHDCGDKFAPKNYAQHVSSHCSRASKNVKPTILVPRNGADSEKPALIKPKPLELLLGFGVSDDYEVLLDGKLVIVDGIHFYVRNGVVFVDCFLCSKSTSLSMLTSHVVERHDDVESVVQCRAKNCRKLFSPAALQDHIQSQHTRVRCKVCSNRLELLQIRKHDRESCSEKSKPYKTEIADSPIPASLRTPSVPSTGIHFLSHFLEDRAQSQVSVSATPKSPLAKDEENNTNTSCCSSVSSGGVGGGSGVKLKNNNSLESLNLARKKKPAKNDRNGKIPTVPCPYCGKQCSYLNKHIRDVHQPKVHCPVCGKRMGKSYLSEHMKIQHQGKEVPTKVCPLCGTRVQKLKNHLKYSHKMSREEADEVYAKFYPTR